MTRDPAAPSPEDWPFTTAASRDLVSAAHVARALAARHCGDCRWYHGYWTWWRALGLASGADLDREFFGARAGGLPDAARVLVSGSADSALPAVAADLAGGDGVEIHLVDRCETPLHIAADFARQAGFAIRTHAHDVAEFDAERGFHLILVHTFLGFVHPGLRARVFERWHSLLAPGGTLRMVQRIRPADGPAVLRFGADEARRFAESVAERARALTSAAESAELARAAREYARRKRTHPVSGAGDLEGLASGAGLRVVDCEVAEPVPVADDLRGPSLRSGARYVYLVAARDR